jgi:hypothetical protein
MAGWSWQIASANLAVSWGLMLLIWLVQIVIYPTFARIPADRFRQYHRWYVKRIGLIVAPMMLIEVFVLVLWLFSDRFWLPGVIAAGLVMVVWLSTFAIQVPLHNHLALGKDEAAIRRLVNSNWIRTIAWSIKTICVSSVITYHAFLNGNV